jgi:regulator of cell morphogenesis and NO signaling
MSFFASIYEDPAMITTASDPQWETAPLSELIHFIVSRYHAQLRCVLPELIALAERVEDRHAGHPSCPRGLRALLEAMHVAVLEHLAKEERVLFPMILEGYGPRTGGPVRVMELEHDEHQANLARVRELTHELTAPPDACPSWHSLYARLATLEAELLAHMHLENTVLFPRALEPAD